MVQILTTKAGGAGAFERFDLARVPSPCFVVDELAIEKNLKILADVKARSGAKILCALKAFSMHALAPLISNYLDGVCASGLYEARLGREEFAAENDAEVTTFSAGFKADEIDEIISLSDHIIFNSTAQKERFAPLCQTKNRQIGLRINPEHSEGEVEKYDPCAPCSRLGVPISQLKLQDFSGLDGLHMHTLCEQGFEPLARTWAAIEPQLAPFLSELKWINFGGGHHITREDYDRDGLVDLIMKITQKYDLQVYLEPGEAVALDAGILVGEVLDLPHNEIALAITDVSATCHMPDVIEAPYRPAMLGEIESGFNYRFGGPSCLAGDVIGDYAFANPLKVGVRFAFLDQAHYSMVKTNTFNGIALPAIALWNSQSDKLKMVREFGYSDFKKRLS